MAKSKDRVEEVEVVEEAVQSPAPQAPPVVLVRAPAAKMYSFEQWAKLRGKPNRHLGGMGAFLGVEAQYRFTLEAWDAKMKSY